MNRLQPSTPTWDDPPCLLIVAGQFRRSAGADGSILASGRFARNSCVAPSCKSATPIGLRLWLPTHRLNTYTRRRVSGSAGHVTMTSLPATTQRSYSRGSRKMTRSFASSAGASGRGLSWTLRAYSCERKSREAARRILGCLCCGRPPSGEAPRVTPVRPGDD